MVEENKNSTDKNAVTLLTEAEKVVFEKENGDLTPEKLDAFTAEAEKYIWEKENGNSTEINNRIQIDKNLKENMENVENRKIDENVAKEKVTQEYVNEDIAKAKEMANIDAMVQKIITQRNLQEQEKNIYQQYAQAVKDNLTFEEEVIKNRAAYEGTQLLLEIPLIKAKYSGDEIQLNRELQKAKIKNLFSFQAALQEIGQIKLDYRAKIEKYFRSNEAEKNNTHKEIAEIADVYVAMKQREENARRIQLANQGFDDTQTSNPSSLYNKVFKKAAPLWNKNEARN
jgi:hypothetical protein